MLVRRLRHDELGEDLRDVRFAGAFQCPLVCRPVVTEEEQVRRVVMASLVIELISADQVNLLPCSRE